MTGAARGYTKSIHGAALVLTLIGLLLAQQGWFGMSDPGEWTRVASPELDLRAPGELVWSVPPTPWESDRGDAWLRLRTGADWSRLPLCTAARLRVRLRGGVSRAEQELVLEGQALAYDDAAVARLDVDHGAEVRVVIEHGDPELGFGFLWVEGTYERDSRDMDFVRTGARLGAFVALGSAAILASVSLVRGRLRTCRSCRTSIRA